MVYHETMTTYTVKQLAMYAGVSVRTLHHYDAIGLLHPSRQPNGYRRYGQQEVLRLQQILFFRELGFSLDEIKGILSRPDFDVLGTLQEHRALLQKRSDRLRTLLETVDKTIANLRGERDMQIREYYEGFSDEQVEAYRREARERYGEKTVEESERRVLDLGKEKFAEVQAEGVSVCRALVEAMPKGVESPEVQALVERWRDWLENFSHYTDEMLLGLAKMYREDQRFADYYRKYHPDLPGFFTQAIEVWVEKRRGK